MHCASEWPVYSPPICSRKAQVFSCTRQEVSQDFSSAKNAHPFSLQVISSLNSWHAEDWSGDGLWEGKIDGSRIGIAEGWSEVGLVIGSCRRVRHKPYVAPSTFTNGSWKESSSELPMRQTSMKVEYTAQSGVLRHRVMHCASEWPVYSPICWRKAQVFSCTRQEVSQDFLWAKNAHPFSLQVISSLNSWHAESWSGEGLWEGNIEGSRIGIAEGWSEVGLVVGSCTRVRHTPYVTPSKFTNGGLKESSSELPMRQTPLKVEYTVQSGVLRHRVMHCASEWPVYSPPICWRKAQVSSRTKHKDSHDPCSAKNAHEFSLQVVSSLNCSHAGREGNEVGLSMVGARVGISDGLLETLIGLDVGWLDSWKRAQHIPYTAPATKTDGSCDWNKSLPIRQFPMKVLYTVHCWWLRQRVMHSSSDETMTTVPISSKKGQVSSYTKHEDSHDPCSAKNAHEFSLQVVSSWICSHAKDDGLWEGNGVGSWVVGVHIWRSEDCSTHSPYTAPSMLTNGHPYDSSIALPMRQVPMKMEYTEQSGVFRQRIMQSSSADSEENMTSDPSW